MFDYAGEDHMEADTESPFSKSDTDYCVDSYLSFSIQPNDRLFYREWPFCPSHRADPLERPDYRIRHAVSWWCAEMLATRSPLAIRG